MNAQQVDTELVAHLERTFGLTKTACGRLIEEVLEHYHETLEAYVLRRHRELKERDGLKNEQIYQRILDSLNEQRFSAPELTKRQIRRIIYG